MSKLKDLIGELEKNIESQLNYQIDPDSYKRKEREVVGVIAKFQEELLKQVFSMEVVESQIEKSTEAIQKTILQQVETSDAMMHSASRLSDVNATSVKKIQASMEAANQISISNEDLKRSSGKLTDTTEEAKMTVERQVDEIFRIMERIRKISRLSSSSVASINNLDTSVNKISEILKSVQNFYKQTKLLALNASIESARAGEAGKGFAVVASEIGHLAEGSSQSVDEIVLIMNEIDGLIHHAKVTANEEEVEIQSTVEEANGVRQGLHQITEAVKHIEEKLFHMNHGLEQNNQVSIELTSQLTDTVEAFDLVAMEMEDMNDQISISHQHMDEIAEIEGIFKEIASSLNLLTNKYQLNLLSEIKDRTTEDSSQIVRVLENDVLTQLDHFDLGNKKVHQSILDRYLINAKDIEAVWTNDLQGNFIHSNPVAGIKNANIREWFKESVKGKPYISDIYISGISKAPCITISIPALYEGDVVGVLGVDVQLSVK